MSSFLDIDALLMDLLQRARPVKRKQVLRRILADLRKINRQRIHAQQNVDGSAYTPRKSHSKPKRKKMLIGFAKHLKTREVTQNMGRLGYGGASNLAWIHHLGAKDYRGVQMPERQLLGLSELDKKNVLARLEKELFDDG